ncbi:MAG: polysaccharide biosynthesis protein [Opitutaceae bacterium]|nr:polysaccharide biosynthesis protein [Cytophagales bacterium]
MGILKKLASETAVYGLSSIIGRFLNYLLVPFYTSVFLPEQYGVITEVYSYAAFLNVVFIYGMETTYFRQCNKAGVDKEKVFLKIQSLVVITTFVLCSLMMLLSNQIADLLKYPDNGNIIILLAAILGFDAVLAIPFARLRQEGKAKKFAFVKILNILLNIGLNILFLVILPRISGDHNPNVDLVLIANLFANAVQIFFFIEYFTLWKGASLDWHTVKMYLGYGLPIMIMGFAGMINEVVDRIALKFLLPANFYPGKSSLAAVGIYGACYKLSIFMSLGIQAFRYASEPFFFSKAQDKNSPEMYAKIMHWFVLSCAAVLLLISFNLDWIKYFLRNEEYREGLVVVPLLLAANLCLGIYYNLSIWYKLTDKTQIGMWISIAGAVVTIILNVLLVPAIGYLGSAWATLACYGFMTATSYLIGQRSYFVPYNSFYLIGSVSIASIISIIYWNVSLSPNLIMNIALKNFICIIILAFLFAFGKKTKAL